MYLGARTGSTSPVPHASRQPQSESPLLQVVCSPWGSSVCSPLCGYRLQVHPVMLDLGDFMPGESGWVLHGVPQLRIGVAVRDDIEPVAITAVLGDTELIRRQHNCPGGVANPLHLDQPEFP